MRNIGRVPLRGVSKVSLSNRKGNTPMAKNEKTSKGVASKASKILSDPKSTKSEKSVAASALSQSPDKKKGR